MNAKLKIAAFAAITLAAIALPFEYAALLLPLSLALFASAKIPVQRANWKAISSITLFVFAIRALFDAQNGVYLGLLNAAYLAGMLLTVELLLQTTKPQELRYALTSFGLPKKYAFMLTIALEAVPLLRRKMEKVRIAQAARGNSRKIIPNAVPLLHSVFQRAKKLAIALEARGFSIEKL